MMEEFIGTWNTCGGAKHTGHIWYCHTKYYSNPWVPAFIHVHILLWWCRLACSCPQCFIGSMSECNQKGVLRLRRGIKLLLKTDLWVHIPA